MKLPCMIIEGKLVQGAFGIGGATLISNTCKEVGKEQEWREGRGARI